MLHYPRKPYERDSFYTFAKQSRLVSATNCCGQIIATSTKVTPNGAFLRKSPLKCPWSIVICRELLYRLHPSYHFMSGSEVAITVGSCAACMCAIAILTYLGPGFPVAMETSSRYRRQIIRQMEVPLVRKMSQLSASWLILVAGPSSNYKTLFGHLSPLIPIILDETHLILKVFREACLWYQTEISPSQWEEPPEYSRGFIQSQESKDNGKTESYLRDFERWKKGGLKTCHFVCVSFFSSFPQCAAQTNVVGAFYLQLFVKK